MSKSWEGGSTRAWRKTRLQILIRDGYVCQLALPGCAGKADSAHHTHGRTVTGDDPAYLAAACTHCNLKIGDPTRTPDPKPTPRTRW